jgi:CBS domain-containing protein
VDFTDVKLARDEEANMAQSIKELMNTNVVTVPYAATVLDAAQAMRDNHVGDVMVTEKGSRLRGIVTDRDIAVRAVAEGKPPDQVKVHEVCSPDVTALAPDDTVEDAVRIMRELAVRRVPVVDNGKPVGIVSIGDLAQARDSGSALSDISSAEPNA